MADHEEAKAIQHEMASQLGMHLHWSVYNDGIYNWRVAEYLLGCLHIPFLLMNPNIIVHSYIVFSPPKKSIHTYTLRLHMDLCTLILNLNFIYFISFFAINNKIMQLVGK